MKKLCFFLLLSFFIAACSNDDESDNYVEKTACGVSNPKENLRWLNDLIKKSESDKTGNYLGTIWLVEDEENDIFITNMMMGSGGIAYYYFDCQGNSYVPDNFQKLTGKLENDCIIYSSLP